MLFCKLVTVFDVLIYLKPFSIICQLQMFILMICSPHRNLLFVMIIIFSMTCIDFIMSPGAISNKQIWRSEIVFTVIPRI